MFSTITFTLVLLASPLFAQLSLQKCQQLARENFPLNKQRNLLEQSKNFSLDNADKARLPQISLNGQATYQSAVTSVPIDFPGITIPKPSRDQYKVYAEISQSLTDFKLIKQQKELIEANNLVEHEKIEVELDKLRERINQLFFGILLIEAQMKQSELLNKDLRNTLEKTNAAIASGIALKSSASLLQAEMLKVKQKQIELQANRKGYTAMLSLLIGQTVDENSLEKPSPKLLATNINLRQIQLLETQQNTFDLQQNRIKTKRLPKLAIFLQAGAGRPGLNMLSNDFAPYAIGGLKFYWNLSAYYSFKNEGQSLQINRNFLDIQKETLLFNTQITLSQQKTEVDKYQQLISTDQEIIDLRESVKVIAQIQLENGTLTAKDYLSYINDEDQAKQNLALHQLQLLMAMYQYDTTSGVDFSR